MAQSKPRDENMIAALKRERATYVARGDDDRVRQVDEQLKHYGHNPEGAEGDGPKGRTGPEGKQQTADATGPQATGPSTASAPTVEPTQAAPAAAKKAPAKKAAAAPKTQE